MRTERLLKLADHLDNLPGPRRQRFTMEHWFHSRNGDDLCGTAACALGEATTIPEFHDAGLIVACRGFMQSLIPTYEPTMADRYFGTDYLLNGYRAAGSFFDIDHDVALKLFSPDTYPYSELHDPAIVSRRIREAVAQYEQRCMHDNLGADL